MMRVFNRFRRLWISFSFSCAELCILCSLFALSSLWDDWLKVGFLRGSLVKGMILTLLFHLFLKEVVCCCAVVMTIVFNIAYWLVEIESKLCEIFNNHRIGFDGILANKYSCLGLKLYLIKPAMIVYFLQSKPLCRICLQNIGKKVSSFFRDELWYFILTSYDLLVKLRSIWVFKREVPTHHCKENHPRAPDVDSRPRVIFALDHFRSSVAWGTAGCFQLFIILPNIWKSKVHNFQTPVLVQK